MKKLLAILLLAWAGIVSAQSGTFPALVGQRGTTTPTNCTIAQLFFDTDATAGSNIYGCTAANTWTLMTGSSGGATYLAGNGSAAAPSYSFLNSPTTGLYRAAADQIGFSAAGNNVLTVAAASITAAQPISAIKSVAGTMEVLVDNEATTGTTYSRFVLRNSGDEAVSLTAEASGASPAVAYLGTRTTIPLHLQYNNATVLTINAANVTVAHQIVTAGYTVAALPAGVTGGRAHVTDQLTTCAVPGAALTGGGAVTCPVFYNGAAWVGG